MVKNHEWYFEIKTIFKLNCANTDVIPSQNPSIMKSIFDYRQIAWL